MATQEGAAWAVLLVLLAAITAIDLRSQRIPDALNGALLLAGLWASTLPNGPGLHAAVVGAGLGVFALLLVAIGFRQWRGIDGLGGGDVKFLAGAGAWTGWQGIGPVVLVASTAALLVVLLQKVAGVTRHPRQPFAFAPYLCLAVATIRAVQSGCTGGVEPCFLVQAMN